MKPVPVPGNPWRKCQACGEEFAPKTEEHVYCCGSCRQQAYRARNRPLRLCPGCGVQLVVGQALEGGEAITARTRYCSGACRQRVYKWRRDGRMYRCQNEECPRHLLVMVHKYDDESQMWKCQGCGQLQPARW